MTGWLTALLVSAGLWLAGRRVAVRGTAAPSLPLHAILGFFGPAGLLSWRRRPFPEQLIAWVVGLVAWAGVFVARDVQMFIAFGLIGAAWGTVLGLDTLKAAPSAPAPPPVAPAPPQEPPTTRGEDEPNGGSGFALGLRCPACGASLAVPVYHRMAHCEFCSSDHVVLKTAGHLNLVIPDTVTDKDLLAQSVVRYLRDRRYLELYDMKVRPLTGSPGLIPDPAGGEPDLLGPDPNLALVNAAEAEVSKAADEWAARIAPRVRVESWQRFLSPYWHRLGTLYQAAFGRDRAGTKRMEFSVAAIEGSVAATSFPLPEMGKLSYLRVLRPLLGSPEAATPALPVDRGPEEIERRAQLLARRSIGLTIMPIAMHSTLVPEVVALVYRPWHVAAIELDGERHALLVDGGSGRVEGQTSARDVPTAPVRPDDGAAPSLAPNRCPDCGAALPFTPDSVAFLCRSCFRLVELRGARWASIPYLREEPAAGHRQVPFWRFPLRVRTAAGALITDIPHLTDGIDGTFDQIGDRPQQAQEFFVPAFRTRVSKAGVQLYRHLWPAIQGWPRELRPERFGPANPPERTVEVTLAAAEARVFARVYLALAFTQRDLARAEVRGVRERFLSAELEGDAQLAFLSLPDELLGQLDGLFGRARITALAGLEE